MASTRIVILSTLSCLFVASTALAGGYVGGGTFVVKSNGLTVVDNGGVVCQGMDGSGVGGGCLPFPEAGADGTPPSAFVGVNDASAGNAVAFQVCIDNSGDGICGGPQTDPACRDQIFFSHSDGGVFHNPLGPLPTSAIRGCASAFPGYVVLLCQGEHNDARSGPHTHTLTTGTIFAAKDGTGYGDFCGGNGGGTPVGGFGDFAAKAYRVV
jgi:hypothetical protein